MRTLLTLTFLYDSDLFITFGIIPLLSYEGILFIGGILFKLLPT